MLRATPCAVQVVTDISEIVPVPDMFRLLYLTNCISLPSQIAYEQERR